MDDVHDRAPARKAEIVIPKRSRGRQSVAAQLAYQEQVEEFCSQIGKIRGSLDFEVSARGWCYILEEHGATKTIERLLVACRKSGDLSIDIRAEDEGRVAEHIEDLNEAVPAASAQGWLNYVRDHAHQQCNINSPRVRDVAASPLGVPLDLLTRKRAMIKISHSMTSDSPDGQPWPPPESDVLWFVVRRADGCTLWRAIQLAQFVPLPRTVQSHNGQQISNEGAENDQG